MIDATRGIIHLYTAEFGIEVPLQDVVDTLDILKAMKPEEILAKVRLGHYPRRACIGYIVSDGTETPELREHSPSYEINIVHGSYTMRLYAELLAGRLEPYIDPCDSRPVVLAPLGTV